MIAGVVRLMSDAGRLPWSIPFVGTWPTVIRGSYEVPSSTETVRISRLYSRCGRLSRRGFHLVDQNPRNDSKGLVLHDIVGAGRPCGKKILQELSVDSYEQTTLPQASPLLETTGSPGPSGAFFLDDHRVSGDCQLGS